MVNGSACSVGGSLKWRLTFLNTSRRPTWKHQDTLARYVPSTAEPETPWEHINIVPTIRTILDMFETHDVWTAAGNKSFEGVVSSLFSLQVMISPGPARAHSCAIYVGTPVATTGRECSITTRPNTLRALAINVPAVKRYVRLKTPC